ncbi:hypothetical protein [Cryobacterium sp. Hb1]|nr:hypothetical protein [Cryobacterium sp. Hb1]
MFILFFLLTALAVTAIVGTIRAIRRDSSGRRAPLMVDEYDAAVRWR